MTRQPSPHFIAEQNQWAAQGGSRCDWQADGKGVPDILSLCCSALRLQHGLFFLLRHVAPVA